MQGNGYVLPTVPSLTRKSNIYIDGVLVQTVSSFKLLGVMLRSDLSWCDQVDYVIKKANSRLYALRQLKKAGLNVGDLVVIYSTFIRSCIEYASPAWSALMKNQSDVIESIQRERYVLSFLACHTLTH